MSIQDGPGIVSEKSATCFGSCIRHSQVSNWKGIGMVPPKGKFWF